MSTQSLKSKIKSAKSDTAVSDLLKEGKTYIFASKKTRSAWVHASRRTLAGLKGQTYIAPKEAEAEFVEKKEKKQRNKKK